MTEVITPQTEKILTIPQTNVEIKYVDIDTLKPYTKNPRKNDKGVDIVAKSIQEFGFKNPIILDQDNEIIAGHTRLRAAFKLGLKQVPTIKATDLTKQQAQAFRIMDNKSQEFSWWDMRLLEAELRDLQGKIDLTKTGFTEAEVERMLSEQSKISQQGKKEPKYQIKIGDVYQLGKHKLICGDATKEETYQKLIGKETVHMLFTDPPYGVSYSGLNVGANDKRGVAKTWETIKGDNLRGNELFQMLKDAFNIANNYLIKNGPVYVFHASSTQMIFETALEEAGFMIKQQLIWVKPFTLSRSHYHWSHEPIFYACRIGEQPRFTGTRTNTTVMTKIDIDELSEKDCRDLLKKIKEEATIWELSRADTSKYIHPTQKPTTLSRKAIINHLAKGEAVLDMFGGSMSTLMACENTGRKCYTIELDPVYCSHGIERWENETGQTAVKL